MEKHILFTARDIGAAHQINPIVHAFRKKGIKVSIVASGEAYQFLGKEGVNPDLFSLDNGKSFVSRNAPRKVIKRLLESSHKVIKEKQPDVVFCGLATLELGIDEAVLYWASRERLNIPSFQFLDTWGTFNHLRDGYPDLYFAIDKASERLGNMGAKAPIQVVGSPKHFAYLSKPMDMLREVTRENLGIEENEKLVGYFGQDPEIPGHTFNFEKLMEAVNSYCLNQGKCKLLFRPHPTYEDKYGPYWEYIENMGISTIAQTEGLSVEELLCACDLITTCFSTVGLDHIYLSSFSKKPIGVVLYLLCGNEIKKHLVDNFGYWKIPILEDGVGFYVDDPVQIYEKVESILDGPLMRIEYFQYTKTLNMTNPYKKIIRAVSSFL